MWHLTQLEMNGFVKRDGEGNSYSTKMTSEASNALEQYQKLVKTVQSLKDFKSSHTSEE
jgi:predicted transcriptional regulator